MDGCHGVASVDGDDVKLRGGWIVSLVLSFGAEDFDMSVDAWRLSREVITYWLLLRAWVFSWRGVGPLYFCCL